MNRKILISLLALFLVLSTFFVPDQQVTASTYSDFTQIVWTRVANQPQANAEGQGIVLNGLLYSFGGFDSKKPCCTPTRRAYAYNPVTDVWTALPDMPKGVTHAGLTTDGQAIYYAGGYIENASQTGQVFGTDQVWKYDPALNEYSAMPKMPKKVSTGNMTYLNGKLHYIGGTERNGSVFVQDLPDHFTFDLEAYKTNPAEEWVDITATAPLPNPRQHAGIAVLNNRIYYVGGQHNHDGQLTPQKSVHYYDPDNNTWTQVANLPGNGLNHIGSSTIVFGGRILVLGGQGYTGSTGPKDTVLAYDPDLDTWTNLTNLPFVQFSAVAGVIDNVIYFSAGSKAGDASYNKATHKGVPVLLDATATPTDDPGETNTDVPSTETPTETSVPPTHTETATATDDPQSTDTPPAATETDNPDATPTSTGDPAATNTSIPDGEATATSTSTSIPPTSTDSVPTDVQGTELLINGDFEIDFTGDKVPDDWTPKKLAKDKLKCKPEKAYQGSCAFAFKGSAGENAKLIQNINLASYSFAPGNTLHLSAALKAKNTVNGKFKVVIKYGDNTPKNKISVNMTPTSGYQVINDTTFVASANVTKIKTQIVHKSLSGKTFIDAVSLKLIP